MLVATLYFIFENDRTGDDTHWLVVQLAEKPVHGESPLPCVHLRMPCQFVDIVATCRIFHCFSSSLTWRF